MSGKIALLTRVLDPALLLERAVDGLFPLAPATNEQPWPTLSAWLVMRQGGLRDDIHRLAAARGVAGWFDPSICLFTELRALWGDPAPAPSLSEPERHAILARLIDEKGRACFGRGAVPDAWVPVVDAFVGELVGEGVTPPHFADAMHLIATDEFDTARAEALGAIYAAWHETIARAGRSDGRDAKVRLAREIAAEPVAFARRLGGRRDIRIVGLVDLRGGWRHLLRALRDSGAVDRLEILTSATLALPADLAFGMDDTLKDSAPAPMLEFWESPDVAREAELVAVRVRKLVDGGVPPRRIAVVARQARPAVDTISIALSRVGVPVTARRRTALIETTPAGALLTLLNVAREEWSRHGVVELAEHPLLETGLDARILNQVGFARAMRTPADWRESLVELQARCMARERAEDEPESRRSVLPPSTAVAATLTAWDALSRRLESDPLQAERTLVDWCEWARRVLRDPSWGLAAALEDSFGDAGAWRTEHRSREEIETILDLWISALATFGAPAGRLDAARFHDRLSLMLAQDLVTPPETDFGVVVAEALAAGWRAFDHLFVVGMSAGEFPRRPSAGQLIDARERSALIAAGLPLEATEAWRDRERDLFRVLRAAPRATLTLSWPAMDADGSEVARSAFIDERMERLAAERGIVAADGGSLDDALETAQVLRRFPAHEVLVDGFPAVQDATVLEHARGGASRERDRDEAADAWNGRIEDAAVADTLASRYDEPYEWSATQLEQAAKCRWQWFAARLLGLETMEDADDQLEPTVSGAIRHEALHRFFTRAVVERGGPVQLMEPDRAWSKSGIATALDEAWAAAAARGEWLGPAVLQAIARAELLRDLQAYVAFEIRYNEDGVNRPRTNAAKIIRSGAVEGEVRFGDLPLEAGAVRFRLRGSIDRVDEGLDERVEGAGKYLAAIDYKSSKYSTPAAGRKEGWADGVVLQVPLYAAALAALRPGHVVARMEYRTLRRPEVVHQLALFGVKGSEIVGMPDSLARLEVALGKAGVLITDIRSGVLPAAPTRSSGCPPFCPARDVCRIPGGPRDER